MFTIEPSVTLEECRSAGRELGSVCGGSPRADFEQALVMRLSALGALGDALAQTAVDADEALAALDQAAWASWEAAQDDAGRSRSPAKGRTDEVKRKTRRLIRAVCAC